MSGVFSELVTGFTRLEQLSPYWRRWVAADPHASIFQTWEWARAYWKAYHRSVSLCSVAVHGTDGPIGILPLVRRGSTLEFLGAPESDYCDLLCEEGRGAEVLEAAVELLLRAEMPWRSAVLLNVPAHSRLAAACGQVSPAVKRHLQMVYRCPCPAVTADAAAPHRLPELMDKEQLRRYDRKLRKMGNLTYRHFDSREEARSHLEGFFQQHITRWTMSGVESQFLLPERRQFFEALVDTLDPIAQLRFGVLELDSQPVAYHFGFGQNGVLTWYKPAFHVNYWDYCPGDVLIRQLLSYTHENGLAEFDFTIGDESFKKRFADTIRSNHIIYIERSAWSPGSLALAAARRSQDIVRKRPEWKAYLQEQHRRLSGLNERYLESGGWRNLAKRAASWVCSNIEQSYYCSPLRPKPGKAAAYQITVATLEDLVVLGRECRPALTSPDLRKYRARLKRRERLLLAKDSRGEVVLFWVGPLADAMPVSEGAPVTAILEFWAMPERYGGTVSPKALRAVIQYLAPEPVWIVNSSAKRDLAPVIAAAGFELRCRLSTKTVWGKSQQTWFSERGGSGSKRSPARAEVARACS